MKHNSRKERKLKTLILTALAFFIVSHLLYAQEPGDILWNKIYGWADEDTPAFNDAGYSVEQTSDGGYIVVGETKSFGAGLCDVYLVKTDENGDTLWTRTYGGAGNDWGNSVKQTSDGGYVIIGGCGEVYLVKTDENGDTLWTRTYGGSVGYSVEQTSDGGYIIAGRTFSDARRNDFYLIKTDENGDTLWTRTYGGIRSEIAYSVEQTTDGGYIVAGDTESFGAGYFNFYLIKTDENGDTLWTRTYGGDDWEIAYSVQQTFDNGYIVGGRTRSFGAGYYDFYLVKTDAEGDILWTKTYGGYDDDCGESVRQTSDGGYIFVGSSTSFGNGSYDAYIIKTDSLGDTLWTTVHGDWNWDFGVSVRQTFDGEYVVAGYTNSFSGNLYEYNAWLFKVSGDGTDIEDNNLSVPMAYCLSQNYPNPFNAGTNIEFYLPKASDVNLVVYNLAGQKVRHFDCGNLPAGSHSITWDGRDENASVVSSGTYFYQLTAGDFRQSRQMLFLK